MTTTPETPIAELMDLALQQKIDIDALNAQLKLLKAKRAATHGQILELLEANGTRSSGTENATAFINTKVVPQIIDFALTWEFIRDNNAVELLHRRVNTAAFNEMRDTGIEVPGVEPVTKKDLLIRKR